MNQDDQPNLFGDEAASSPNKHEPHNDSIPLDGPVDDRDCVSAGVSAPSDPGSEASLDERLKTSAGDEIAGDDASLSVAETHEGSDRERTPGPQFDATLGSADAASVGFDEIRTVDGSDSLPDAGGAGSDTEVLVPGAVYFLTNRLNLIRVLSSRLVAPRESYEKYYGDLLELAPGWVPLLTAPPSEALIGVVTRERGGGSPVLIEFPRSVVEGEDSVSGFMFVAALPLAAATAIHFRDERSLREHRARGFANVHPHDELLTVTPKLFEGTFPFPEHMDAPANARVVDWRAMDRMRGAISAAMSVVDSGEALAVGATVLGGANVPDVIRVPKWLAWPNVVAPDDDSTTEVSDPDAATFRTALAVLRTADITEEWNPRVLLDGIRTALAEAVGPGEPGSIIDRNLDRVRAIVDVEREFEPFRSTGTALISAMSLLLVLLRPRLADVVGWPEEDTGADEVTRVAAAMLAGSLRGLAREDSAMRHVNLDDATATWAAQRAQGLEGYLPALEFVASPDRTEVRLAGVVMASAPPLVPDPLARYQSLSDVRRLSAGIRIARALGVPVSVVARVTGKVSVDWTNTELIMTTDGAVVVSESVDVAEVVQALSVATPVQRRAAVAALDAK